MLRLERDEHGCIISYKEVAARARVQGLDFIYIRQGQLTQEEERDSARRLNGLGRKIRLVPQVHPKSGKKGYDPNFCYLQEGQFKDDELSGFGRRLWSNGHQFIGWVKGARLHGWA